MKHFFGSIRIFYLIVAVMLVSCQSSRLPAIQSPSPNPGRTVIIDITATFTPTTAYTVTPTPLMLTDTWTPTLVSTSTRTSTSIITPQPITSTIVSTQLSKTGPWLVIGSDGIPGVTAFNIDGSGEASLDNPTQLTWYNNDINTSAIQGGQWLALRGVKDPVNLKGVYLDLVHLPDDQVIQVSRMDSDWPYPNTPIISGANNAISNGKILWSPDGKYIAFSAALNGSQFADLYLAKTAQPGLIRLTTKTYNAYPLAWTPDSRQIIYAEIGTCGGNGCNVDSVWMASPGKQDQKLYDARSNHFITFVGFMSTDQIIFYGGDGGAPKNLRSVNLSTGQSEQFYSGHLLGAALDPGKKKVFFNALSISDSDSLGNGLYEISQLGRQPKLIKAGTWNQIIWLPQINQFRVGGTVHDGSLLVAPDGKATEFDQENWWTSTPEVSPDGKIIAFCGSQSMKETPGLRLYDLSGKLLQTITQEPVEEVSWRPDSQGLFYLSNGNLYYLNGLNGTPMAIASISSYGLNSGYAWIK